MKENSSLRWKMQDALWKFDAKSPSDYIEKTRPYTLEHCVDNIKCHMLIIDVENDHLCPGQAEKLFEALNCPKQFIMFKESEGAGIHCQPTALALSNQRILDWIETC